METTPRSTYKNRTAGSLMYLLLAFPLGLIYFVFLVVGLSVGLGTLIIWIGIPILFLTIAGLRGVAALERDLAEHMLGIPMPRVARVQQANRTWRAWIVSRMGDALTWRSLIYVLIKFPLGIFTFTLALTLPLLAIGFLFEPLIYLINTFINGILLANCIHSSESWMPFFVTIDGRFDPVMFFRSCIGIPIGLVGWYLVKQVLNGLAYGLGMFTRAMLSPSVEESLSMPKTEQQYQYQAMEMRQG